MPYDLDAVVTDIERHLHGIGWGSAPRLFALVRTGDLLTGEPQLAASLGDADPDSLTPVEQDPIEEDVADLLPRIEWPPEVLGCALSHELVMVSDATDEARPEGVDPFDWAMADPRHREMRAVAAALRTGETAATVRVRGQDGGTDEVVVDREVVPNMTAALLETLVTGT